MMPHADLSARPLRRLMLLLAGLAPFGAAAADLAAQAATLTADVPHGHVLFLKHCADCHGHRAWGNGVQVIPSLAGQRETYLIAQLAHFLDSKRPGSALHGQAMHDAVAPPDVGRAQALRDLSGWLSTATPNAAAEHGAGHALAAGKRLYLNGCAGCHGADGAGSEQPAVPALASQHYSYLLGQLRSFSAGTLPHAAGLTPALVGTIEEQQRLADYLSRESLPPAASRP